MQSIGMEIEKLILQTWLKPISAWDRDQAEMQYAALFLSASSF